jgi:hypothetical protein
MFIYGYDQIFSQQLFLKRTFLAQVLSLERKCIDGCFDSFDRACN